jgi:hypothetical protein
MMNGSGLGPIKNGMLINFRMCRTKSPGREVDEGPGRTVVYCTTLIVVVKECIFMCIVGGYWSAVDRDRLLTNDGC